MRTFSSKLTRGTLVLSLILNAPYGVVFAQSPSVAGIVRDGNGTPLPGATVTTIPQSGGTIRHTTSGSDGSYRFDVLPDGVYRIDFDLRGFELVRRNHVRVSRETEANIDAQLSVRAICECLTRALPIPWVQRSGQVTSKTGHPLPHARIEVIGREALSADGEGRFLVRVPVNETLSLTATDTGFRPVTQQFSGVDVSSVVLGLEYMGITGVPDVQRFGGCECPGGYLLPYGGR